MSSTTGSIWMLDDVEPGGARTGSRCARDWRRVYNVAFGGASSCS